MPILGAFIVPHPPLIIPEIGNGRERAIQKTTDAYHRITKRISELNPETIVVISPHSVLYGDYIHISPGDSASGSFHSFGAGGISYTKKYDSAFVGELSEQARGANLSAGTLGEKNKSLDHGVLVPLYFIEKAFQEYKLVRISISGLSFQEHYRFGTCIRDTAERLSRRIVILASGDLSHKLTDGGPYGFAPEGPEFDKQAIDAIKTADFMRLLMLDEAFCEKAAECGLRSFIIMAGALDGKSVRTELLSYEGPFGVGYAVCAYEIIGEDGGRRFGERLNEAYREHLAETKETEDDYVRLARRSLETYIKQGKRMKRPAGLPTELMERRAGVFVSLKKNGRLRGCIGTISPTASCVADEIIQNAVSAGTDDPRFEPVTEDELPFLLYSVDVLSETEPISSIDELDIKRYGVVVTKGNRRGLLLPNLEGVDTPERQVSIALEKAGIHPNEPYRMERFEVVRHK